MCSKFVKRHLCVQCARCFDFAIGGGGGGGGDCLASCVCRFIFYICYFFWAHQDDTWDLTPINSFQGEHLENGFHFYDYCGILSISFNIARVIFIAIFFSCCKCLLVVSSIWTAKLPASAAHFVVHRSLNTWNIQAITSYFSPYEKCDETL